MVNPLKSENTWAFFRGGFYSVVKNLVLKARSEIVGYAIENGRQEYRIQESEFRMALWSLRSYAF